MQIQLEELELRTAPSGVDLSGSIATQAMQVQTFVQQQLASATFQVNSAYAAAVELSRLAMVWDAIEPVVLTFAANGTLAMGGSEANLAGFAGSLEQVTAVLNLPWHG